MYPQRQEMGELARLAEEGADLASHAALPGTLQRLEVLMDHLLLSTCRPPAIVVRVILTFGFAVRGASCGNPDARSQPGT